MDYLISMVPNFSPSIVTVLLCLVTTIATAFLLTSGVLSEVAWALRILIAAHPGGENGRRRGLSIQVTDHAVAHRVLVQQHSAAAFQEHPASATPSTILSRNIHCNIFSAPYGSPFWRAARRNLVAGVLHPSRIHLFRETRARALASLVRKLRSGGAPVGESLRSPVYQIVAEMCFGKEVVAAKLRDAGLRFLHELQRDMLRALPGFKAVVMYPRIGRLLYPFRWAQLVAFRRQQEESFMPLVAEIKTRRKKKASHAVDGDHDGGTSTSTSYSYVESLLDLRFNERDGDMVGVSEGHLVSLISEFLGNASDSTGAALEWTMANLVRHPRVQDKLRAEVNAVVGGGAVDEADLSRMPYLRAVVLESLRRHPTVPFVLRHVKEGNEAAKALGASSQLPQGHAGSGDATVNFLVGKISRDPAVWSDPMAFLPERFMPGGEGELVDLTCSREVKMMPFGAGRRICPGMTLALLHLQFFVANLVKEFLWLEADGDDSAVDFTESHAFPFTTMKRPLQANLVPL